MTKKQFNFKLVKLSKNFLKLFKQKKYCFFGLYILKKKKSTSHNRF